MQLLFRPQSLYLLLGALCAGLMFVFPISTYDVMQAGTEKFFALTVPGIVDKAGLKIADAQPILPFYVVVPLLSAVLVVTMFLYKNRVRQLRVARSSYLISILIIAGSILANNSFIAYLGLNAVVVSSYGISFYLPFAVLAFTFLANRSIKKDEDLVRSLDRLR